MVDLEKTGNGINETEWYRYSSNSLSVSNDGSALSLGIIKYDSSKEDADEGTVVETSVMLLVFDLAGEEKLIEPESLL